MRQHRPSTDTSDLKLQTHDRHSNAAVAGTGVCTSDAARSPVYHVPVKEVMGAQLPSDWAASATSHSFRLLSVDALMTWLLPTQRT